MPRSPLYPLADVLALAEEGVDALVLLSLDAVHGRRRPVGRRDFVDGLTRARRPATRSPSVRRRAGPGTTPTPPLGAPGGGAQGRPTPSPAPHPVDEP